MVLLVQGRTADATALLDGAAAHLSPVLEGFFRQPTALPAEVPCAYACQGEEITVSGNVTGPLFLCSSDATTCVVLVLAAAAAAGQQALARVVHHDESTTRSLAALQQTVAGFEHRTARLWLAGAYADSGGTGLRVASALLHFLQQCEAVLEVELCCLGAHNTAPDGSPRCTALAVDLASLAALPAAPAPDLRGPLLPARGGQWAYRVGSASHSKSSPLRSIQCRRDVQGLHLTLDLQQGRPPEQLDRWLQWMLSLGDEELLQRWSTSPDHEPPHFIEDVRASFSWLLHQQGPLCTAAHAFQWTPAAGWQPVEGDTSGNTALPSAGQGEAAAAVAAAAEPISAASGSSAVL